MKAIHLFFLLSLTVLALAQAGSPSIASAAGATFTVTRTDDPVPNSCAPADCSLREAILASNANGQGATDTIVFNIPGQGVHTLTPTDGLPTVWGPVSIDGLTQPGASCAAWPPTLKIELSGANAGAGMSGLDVGGNSMVRGLVINRFKGHGLTLGGINGDISIVRCNFIGTDPTGTLDLGNDFDGIFTGYSSSNHIGGGNPINRNLISGNGRYGVLILGSGAIGNTVAGNYIGTDVTGQTNLGNDMAGIALTDDTAGNIIGGTSASQGNVVAFNGIGIMVTGNSPGNTIAKNSIISNTGLGIDLGNDGVDDHDVGDADTGPNQFQNYPSLNTAFTVNGTTTIEGTLPGKANQTYIIEFFSVPACDESGHGEGKLYLGQQIVTTNALGNASFTSSLPTSVATGTAVTATATDSADGTSEFAQCRAVSGPSKQNQIISFAPLPDKIVSDPPFTISATASSGLAVTFTASGKCTVNSTTVTLSGGVGSCSIMAHQSGNPTYNAAPDVAQTFAINEPAKQNQAITFDALPDRLTTAPSFQVNATASSGLPVTFTANGQCIVSGMIVTLSGQAGSCAITASQSGDATYNAAPDVTQSFAVKGPVSPPPAKQNQAITFVPLSTKTSSDAPFLVSATASSGLPVTFTANGQCIVSGMIVTLSGQAGTCTVTAAQAGDATYNAAPDVLQTFQITAGGQFRVYLPIVRH